MIDLIRNILLTILNKENRGYVSPEEFNVLAALVQSNIFRSYFEDENRDKNREARGLSNKGYSKLPFNQRQLINQFSEIDTLTNTGGGVYLLPDDLYFIDDDGLISDTGRVIEETEKNIIGYLNNSLSAPSATFPVYERFASSIQVYPDTLGDITCRYLRAPVNPRWTYLVVGDAELFDPTNPSYQDFELHASELPNIVSRMLTHFSINIRDMEIVRIAEQLKNEINIRDNS